MHENMQLIPFLNALEDQYNYPIVTDVTDNKSLHLPNSFVRSLILTSCITRNILLLMMYLLARITRDTKSLDTICISLRELACDLGIKLTGGVNYQSMINMLHCAESAYVQLASADIDTERVLLFQECKCSPEEKTVSLQLDKIWEQVFLEVGARKTVVYWGYLKQLSSPLAIWLYLVCASVKVGDYVLQYKVTHMMHLCGQGTDTVGEFTERLIKAMYEINAKTDVSGALYFVRKGHKIVAVQIKGKAKDKVEMCNAGISVDAQRCALPKVTKADMRKAVVTSKAFRTAPGHLISVSDKHVRYREPLSSWMVDK